MKCFKKTISQGGIAVLPNKITNFIKKIKVNVGIMRNKHRTNAVTPSTCNYDVTESIDNTLNETDFFGVHFKFHDETEENRANEQSESYENERNERLEKRLLEIKAKCENSINLLPLSAPDTYFATPVICYQHDICRSKWAPTSDADICQRGDVCVSECQLPKEQKIPGLVV